MAWRHLTDVQWDQIRPHLPAAPRRPKGGRPPADARRFEGILGVLGTGGTLERTAVSVRERHHLLAAAPAVGS